MGVGEGGQRGSSSWWKIAPNRGVTTSRVSSAPPREPGEEMMRAPDESRAVTPTTSRDRPDRGVWVRPWARIYSAMPGISTSMRERTTSGA